jgi:phytol kinase
MDIFTLDGFIRTAILVAVFGLIVVLGEYLRRSKILVGEGARKFVHITCGTWAALWPFFIDLDTIAFVTLGLALVALLLRRTKVFTSVYSINRISVGEVLIGFGLSASAFLASSGAVYASAVLIISWSDSLAAIIGTRYGKNHYFKVMSSNKSLIGSFTFFVTTFVIVCAFLYYESGGSIMSDPFQIVYAIAIASFVAFALTIVELTGVYGMDNLTIPLFATVVLNILAVN